MMTQRCSDRSAVFCKILFLPSKNAKTAKTAKNAKTAFKVFKNLWTVES